MKVLQVLYSGLGGQASVVFSMIDGDKDRQWKHQLLFYGIEPLNNEFLQKAEKRNVPFSVILAKTGNPLHSWGRFYKELRKAQPDIILLHSVSLILPAWWYCMLNKRKLVAIEHTANQVKRNVDLKLSWLIQKLANRVVLLTENYARELSEMLKGSFKKGKNCIIPNGIDVSYFLPLFYRPASLKIKLGMAGRFTAARDQALLLDVMVELEKINPGRFELIFAGGGENLENVKKIVGAKGLEKKVFFPGTLNEAKMLEFFQEIDIYIQSSKGEAMSTTIMQAMACGLPIVASDIAGINNLLTEDTGLLVTHEPHAFAQAITTLAQSSASGGEMGRKARAYAAANFSNKKMFESYNQLIKLCIEEKF